MGKVDDWGVIQSWDTPRVFWATKRAYETRDDFIRAIEAEYGVWQFSKDREAPLTDKEVAVLSSHVNECWLRGCVGMCKDDRERIYHVHPHTSPGKGHMPAWEYEVQSNKSLQATEDRA